MTTIRKKAAKKTAQIKKAVKAKRTSTAAKNK
jgi:hypothetical protein